MEAYLQFLKSAYKQVVETTLKDESIGILAQMENKNYYFERIDELFKQIYSAEREEKLQQLMITLENSKIQKQVQPKIFKEYIELPCSKCSKSKDQNNLELQSNAMKYKVSLVRQQNEQLSQQLKQANQNYVAKIKAISSIHETTQGQANLQIDNLQKDMQLIHKKYQQAQQSYVASVRKIEDLRKQILQCKEKSYQLELKTKQQAKIRQTFQQQILKLKEQVAHLNQCKTILQDKNRRLIDTKNIQKEKIVAYQKQIESFMQNNKNNSNCIPTVAVGKDSQQIYKQEQVNSLISNLTAKQTQVSRLRKDKQNLQRENNQINRQLIELKISSQKSIIQLKQTLHRTITQCEKELRSYREKQKHKYAQIKQTQLNSKLNQLESYKQKIKALEQEKFQLSNNLLKLQHNNQVVSKNYQQLSNTLSRVQADHENTKGQYEQKLDKYRKLQKQMSKRIKIIQDMQYNAVEVETKQKIKYYEGKLEQAESQLQRYKDAERKQAKQIEQLEKEYKRSNFSEKQQHLMVKEHELTMKVNILESTLEENKLATQELVNKKQQKIKQLKKQIQLTEEKVIQLSELLDKEIKGKVAHEKTEKQLLNLLRQQQQKVISIQQRNRSEILQLMESHEQKIQQLTKQFQKCNGSMIKNKGDLNDKSTVANTLSKLQKQYKGKINNIQEQWSELKAKNFTLQQKYRNSEANLTACKQKLDNTVQELSNARNREYTLQESLQKYKNKEVKLVTLYENKINNFKLMFKEFKYQICHQFLQALSSIRVQVYEMKKNTLKMLEEYKKLMMISKHETTQRVFLHESALIRSYQLQNGKESQHQIHQLEKEKEEMKINYENKLKQKQMDIMTVIAQKQYAIQQIKEIEACSMKKYKDIENNYKKMNSRLEKSQKNEMEMKQIIQKMQSKVDEAEKKLMMKEKQVIYFQKIVQQTNEKLKKCEVYYKKQLAECKQKYRQQNQRLFNRFQRQFNKIVNLNSRKSKDKMNMALMMSRNSQVPTKGGEEDRFVKLKKEIQQQKKIVQQLQSKTRN